jgi:hypothetical protein
MNQLINSKLRNSELCSKDLLIVFCLPSVCIYKLLDKHTVGCMSIFTAKQK